MSLNIKSDRVHALAREAAARTGKSQTSVIEEALTKLLHDLERLPDPGERVDAALAIATDFERRLSAEQRARLSTAGLYDDGGLPA